MKLLSCFFPYSYTSHSSRVLFKNPASRRPPTSHLCPPHSNPQRRGELTFRRAGLNGAPHPPPPVRCCEQIEQNPTMM
jgi:hypothetical protein